LRNLRGAKVGKKEDRDANRCTNYPMHFMWWQSTLDLTLDSYVEPSLDLKKYPLLWFFFVMEGVYFCANWGLYTARAQENPRATPPPNRTEAIRIAFVVHAVEAVGATHGILAVQVVEGVTRKRTRAVW
jgi:hypothetical protein